MIYYYLLIASPLFILFKTFVYLNSLRVNVVVISGLGVSLDNGFKIFAELYLVSVKFG